MAKVIRRQYLGGAAAALSGLLASACGEVEIRYMQGPAGPAGAAGTRGEKGTAGTAGTAGAAGEAGKTIVVKKPVVIEKIVEVPAPPPKREPVTLAFQHRWKGPAREPLVQQAIDMFMEEYAHITVNLTMNLDSGEGTDGGVPIGKILAAIAAGTPRCVHDPRPPRD